MARSNKIAKTPYFSHDLNSRNDPKMQRVLRECGYEGIGIFWSVVEMMYEQGGYLNETFEDMAYSLRCDTNVLQKLFTCFDLFIQTKSGWTSKTILSRIKLKKQISDTRKEAIKKRWQNLKTLENTNDIGDTNVLQLNYNCNTSKVKKSKVNIITTPKSSSKKAEVAKNEKSNSNPKIVPPSEVASGPIDPHPAPGPYLPKQKNLQRDCATMCLDPEQQAWRESVMATLGIKTDAEFRTLMRDFLRSNQNLQQTEKKDLPEFQRHFFFWARKAKN